MLRINKMRVHSSYTLHTHALVLQEIFLSQKDTHCPTICALMYNIWNLPQCEKSASKKTSLYFHELWQILCPLVTL